jgi:SAM-dependent methyltransferase
MNFTGIYPDFVARFYDTIYSNLRSDVDSSFYLKKIKETKGPVLEIGVGTGRLFIPAIQSGADIYGMDVSPSMIKVLKAKLDKKYHGRIFVQNAADLNLKKKFSLVIAPFRIFSHLIEIKDQLGALNKIHGHLKPKGKLIFDVFVPKLKMLVEGISNAIDFDGEYEPGKKLKRMVSMKTDLIRQISDITMKFVWEENGREKSKEWNFSLRYFFRFELEHLISRSKLKLVKILGDFRENELNAQSQEFIVICKRKN